MYEQNEVPVFRRILWIALLFIVAVAVIWALVWLIFFRHPAKVAAPHKPSTQQNQPTSKPPVSTPESSNNSTTPTSPASPGTNPSTAPDTTPSTPSPTATSTTTPSSTSDLPNTGAGNIVVPFAVATVTGSTFYYIRTRRKLLS